MRKYVYDANDADFFVTDFHWDVFVAVEEAQPGPATEVVIVFLRIKFGSLAANIFNVKGITNLLLRFAKIKYFFVKLSSDSSVGT